jgi:predicted transposase YdaD
MLAGTRDKRRARPESLVQIQDRRHPRRQHAPAHWPHVHGRKIARHHWTQVQLIRHIPAMAQAPHDQLFKAVFSRPTEAASFLQAHLPPALAAAIRWDLLTCIKSGFEDPDGTASEADLVFATHLEMEDASEPTDIEIAILFEHQSTPDDHMPLRLLGYMLRTFEAQLNARSRKRPVPVIPVVLYHGSRRWTTPISFAEWMALTPAAHRLVSPFLPDFTYILEKRQPARPDAYRGSDTIRLVRLVLDHVRSPGFFSSLADSDWSAVLVRLDKDATNQGVVPVLAMVINYVYRVLDNAAEPLAKALEAAGAPNLTEIAMNTYQQAIEKGKQLGLSEGKLNERRGLLLRQCERRFGSLTESHRQRIESADADTLLIWAENIVVAGTIDEVFGGPLT